MNVPEDVVLAARRLPYAPDRYFETGGSRFVPVAKLIQTRARMKGIANAVSLMAAAYDGTQSRRAPIQVRALDADSFLVLDGNSTVTIAAAAGWPDVPCVMLE